MNVQKEIEEKTERLMRLLAAEQLGGVLLTEQHNFAWATAGGTNGIDLSRGAGAGALFVRADGSRFVLADNIEMPRLLAEELSEADFEPIEFGWEEEKISPTLLVRKAEKLAGGVVVGVDAPVAGARDIEGQIARLRFHLTDGEVERFRSLGRDAGEAIGELARKVEPGLTEREVSRRSIDTLAARGIHTVVTLVAADERIAGFRHPIPTEKRWNQSLMIVVCARREGLIASLTRIVCAGEIADEMKRRTEACAQVYAAMLHATRPGTTGGELYDVAARAYAAAGFPGEEHRHHQGGAAGYRTREWVAYPGSAEVVQERQAFAWNPTITGSKTEETCIASAGEIEIITASPGWAQEHVELEGCEYVLPGVMPLT